MDISNLMSYFIIYSFLGWVIESVYKTYMLKKPINSGFLYGPICPIYGFGAIIMLLLLKNFSNNIVLLFITSFFLMSAWEYIVGVILEKVFKTKYWDYSDRKFNINGRICLMNSCFWGFLGVIFITFVHAPIENLINEASQDAVIYLNNIIFVLLAIDCIFSIIKVYNINVSINSLNDITTKLKQELEKIKTFADTKAKESEVLQHVIEELKEKEEIIKQKIEKQTARLRKAFPTMRSLKISEIFNQRIDSIKKNK